MKGRLRRRRRISPCAMYPTSDHGTYLRPCPPRLRTQHKHSLHSGKDVTEAMCIRNEKAACEESSLDGCAEDENDGLTRWRPRFERWREVKQIRRLLHMSHTKYEEEMTSNIYTVHAYYHQLILQIQAWISPFQLAPSHPTDPHPHTSLRPRYVRGQGPLPQRARSRSTQFARSGNYVPPRKTSTH